MPDHNTDVEQAASELNAAHRNLKVAQEAVADANLAYFKATEAARAANRVAETSLKGSNDDTNL